MRKRYYIIIIAAIVFLCVHAGVQAEEPSYREVKLTKLTGEVFVKTADSGEWVKAAPDMIIRQNDKIKTGKNASATIIFDENGSFDVPEKDYINIHESTELLLAKLAYDKRTKDKTTLLELNIGKIVANAAKLRTKDSKFEVKTPTSVVGVRGTNYVVEYHPKQ